MKLTHAEGSGSILKSRFARGLFPLVAALLACALAAPEARAGDLHTLIDPSTLTATANTTTSNGSGSRTAQRAVDGSGMNADGTHASNKADGLMWEGGSLSTPARFTVDLGRQVYLDGIKFWNFNWSGYTNRGAKNIEIYYTDDASIATLPSQSPIAHIRNNWTALKTDYVLPMAPGNSTYAGEEMLTFPDVSARWVTFVITTSYGGNGGLSEVRFYEHAIEEGEPYLMDCLLNGSSGSYTVSGRLGNTSATMGAVAKDGQGNSYPLLESGETAIGAFEVSAPAGLAGDATYEVSARAVHGDFTVDCAVGTIYTGTPVLEWVRDGSESGRIEAQVRVSRVAADPFPLVVNYTVTSSQSGAAEGKNWIRPSGRVTIPANETSAIISIEPLIDVTISDDVVATVELSSGTYLIETPQSADITIENMLVPDGYNIWVAAADGLASTAGNWTLRHAPISGENVLFDGCYSTANCEWDVAASATVASWTQTNGYTGTVTFDTTYSGTFPVFTISGDAMLDSGTWSHPLSLTTTSLASNEAIQSGETYRMNIAVGGTLTIGAGGSVNVVGKGVKQTAGDSPVARHGGSTGSSGICYDNPKYPIDVGSAAWSGTDAASKKAAGGGAVHIVAGTAVVVNGMILADGESKAYACGAGGSILVEAPSVTGSGTIRAGYTYATGNANSVLTGAGGRVALITTNAVDLTSLAVSASAYATGGNKGSGGAGTVYLYDSSMTNGVLIVDNPKETSRKDNAPRTGITADGDWTFDEVRIGGWCQLMVLSGGTLHLPNGLESVKALADASAEASSIYVAGGTLDVGESANQTMRGTWELAALTNLVFTGNLSLADGAMLGKYSRSLSLDSNKDVWSNANAVCAISVAGNLTVDSSSSLSVRLSGFGQKDSGYFPGYGNSSHGGCYGTTSTLTGGAVAYGSILHPRLPARFQSNSYYQPGGGALVLSVGGTLTLNGQIDSDGYSGGNTGVRGAGGSIDITAGSLEGSGAIHADGYTGESGGRVAVRLTRSGATFDSFTGRISARRDTNGNTDRTAPGTVYLQTAGQAEGAGTIVVDGTPRSGTVSYIGTPYTPIPANGAHPDDVADLKKCALNVSNRARCAVATTLKLEELVIDTTSILDLCGATLTVKSAKLGETKLAPGTYAASNAAVEGFVVDSATGGALVVRGGGFSIIVR